MADGEATWWDYVKAAFHFRLPIRWLGGVPLNKAALAVAAVFCGLFAWAGQLAAAAGVVLLATAAELYYLHLMCSLPMFRSLVRAELLSQVSTDSAGQLDDLLVALSKAGRMRYEQMAGVCHEIESLLTKRQREADGDWAAGLKTGGLQEVRTLYARLLAHEESLQTYLATRSVLELPKQIREVESDVANQKLSAAVRHSKEQTLAVLKQRAQQISQMGQACELGRAELDRLDQHLALLRDQAAAGGDVASLVEQIDGAVAGVGDSTAWLLDSERLLGDAPEQTKVDA